MSPTNDQLVRQVLIDLRFPAEKWQIVTQAELYGADAATKDQLHRLPMGEYRDCSEVAAATLAEDEQPADPVG